MEALGAILSGIIVLAVFVLFAAGNQIFILLALREVRKMAATIPEKDREAWINAVLNSMNDATPSETVTHDQK